MKDKFLITGRVLIELRDKHGKVKASEVTNMVVTDGKEHVADQLVGRIQDQMSHMSIGVGDDAGGATPPALDDYELQHDWSRLPTDVTQLTGGNANQVQYFTLWEAGQGTGSITEAGVFNAPNNGVMLVRTTFAAKNKGVSDTLSLTWTLTIN